MLDAHLKGRLPWSENRGVGSGNQMAKLSEESVLEILHERATQKTTYKVLAKKHGVSMATIGGICAGTKWRSIDRTGVDFESKSNQ